MNATVLSDGDYVLGEGSAWFTVGKFSVHIHKTDEGVIVDLFDEAKAKREGDYSAALVAATYAFNHELEGEELLDA